MAGPAHWGTRPDLVMAKAKKKAKEAAKKGSPKGLTTLERGFYDAELRRKKQCVNQAPTSSPTAKAANVTPVRSPLSQAAS